MASIQKRPNGKWRARFRDEQRREHAGHFDTKAAAQRWLDEQTSALVRGDFVTPDAGRVLFREYAEEWRGLQVQHRPTTAAQVETNLRLHVYPQLGDLELRRIRPNHIQALVRELTSELAPATVEVVYRYISAILRSAVADQLIPKSPAVGPKLPAKIRTRVEPLPVEMVWRLADAIEPRYRALVVLGAGTGLRQGEALGLTLDRVDFLRRRLTVDRQLVLLPGAGPELGPPKTAASVRDVPVPDVVLEELSQHLIDWPADTEGFVFTDQQGRPIRRTRFSPAWRRAVADAGAPAGTRFHDLRHHYASLLIRYGESVKVVQSRLGHASAAETLETYSHLWPDSDDRTRDAVEQGLRGNSADHARTAEAAD